MNNSRLVLAGLAVGLSAGALLTYWLLPGAGGLEGAAAERKPLYWVAPMDPEYRRDQPGKSPMGMDLIPVYDEPGASPGTVQVSPAVVNGLGVRSATVAQRVLHSAVHTVGYVQFDQEKLRHIHPRVEGWIERLHVNTAGDEVVAGQPLYSLYSPTLVNAQQELLLAMARGNRDLQAAAEERLLALQFPRSALAELKQSKQAARTVTFLAPITGVVDALSVREGFFVKPDTTLMALGTLDEVWVEAEVFERQSALVRAGNPVLMSLNFVPGRVWRGQVDYVYPSVDPGTRTVKVRMRFANPERLLKPNMFAQVEIQADSEAAVLAVPREALIRTGRQQRVVLDLGEGKFRSVEVRTGHYSDDYVEVLVGLHAGDRVVTSAQFLLDSESSGQMDLARLDAAAPTAAETATVTGQVLAWYPESRVLRIAHDAIPQWDRPAMIMNFVLAEQLEAPLLGEGTLLQFSFAVHDGEFVISQLELLADTSAGDAQAP